MSQQSLNSLAPEFMNNKYERSFVDKVDMGHHYEGKLSPEDYKRWCQKMAEIEKCGKRIKECNTECDPEPSCCEDPCAETSSFTMGWLGMLLLWFIIFTVLFWLIFYSLKPSWAMNSDGSVNTGKVLLASIIAAIILVIVIWLIKSCIDCSR